MSNALATDRFPLLAAIDPDVTAAGTVTSGWVDLGSVGSIVAMAAAGTLGTNATFDVKLEQATDGSGTGAKDVSGKAATQLTEAGTDQSDNQVLINCRGEELDTANEFTHVRLSIAVGTATSDACGFVFGADPRYTDMADATSVAEIVA